MRRTVRILLLSLTLMGVWNQVWQVLGGLVPGHHHRLIVPTCGGGANPDGSCG